MKKLLYPKPEFPFDRWCRLMVRRASKIGWGNVPGVGIELSYYNPITLPDNPAGEPIEHYKVQRMTGSNWELFFGREQDTLVPKMSFDTAGVSAIFIPGQVLYIGRRSPPRLHVYTGWDWEKDRQDFNLGRITTDKLYKRPRRGACYIGSSNSDRIAAHNNMHAPYLVAHSCKEQAYLPEGAEPTYYQTAEVYAEFAAWLQQHALPLFGIQAAKQVQVAAA